MKGLNLRSFFLMLLIALAGLTMICGCNGGEQVIDEVTGNRAVKQFQKSKKDIGKIAEQQAEKYRSIPGEEEQEDDEQ